MTRVFALVAVAIGVGIGCSSSSDDSGSTSASEVTATNDAGPEAATTIDPCAPCAERFPAGAATLQEARRHCFCADDLCHDACASTQCQRTGVVAANDTCNACINDNFSRCVQVVEAACESDAECTRYAACKVPASCPKK